MRIPENTYNKKTRAEISAMVHPFELNLYLKERGAFSSFDTCIVGTLKYIENIPEMMSDFSLDEWKDYLKWNVIRSASPYMDQTFVDLYFDFYGKKLKGKKELKKLEERAIEEITSSELAEILGKAFVQVYFSEEAKAKVNRMVDNLLFVFQKRI